MEFIELNERVKKLEKQVKEHEEKLELLVHLLMNLHPELLQDFVEWKKDKGIH